MPRRGAREGSIRQRKDGRWEGRVFLGYQDGKRLRPSVYGETRKVVQTKLAGLTRDHRDGVLIADGRTTLGEFLDTWLEDFAKPNLKVRTFEGYSHHVTHHIKPDLGRVPLQQLSAQHLQRWVNRKATSGLAVATVRYMFAVLRTALNKAERLSLIRRNPTFAVDLPSRKKHQARFLSAQEARQFLTASTGHRLGPLFSVALAVGLRIGEAFALRWSDLDLPNSRLTVNRTLFRSKGEFYFGEPKSETSRRTLSLPAFAVEALQRHRTAQKAERLKVGEAWPDLDLVFTTPLGTPLDYSNCRKEFHKLLKVAQLPMMRIHDLRHTCASLLLARGVSMKVVQDILGHSQMSITADIYSHVGETLRSQAAAEMDLAMTGA